MESIELAQQELLHAYLKIFLIKATRIKIEENQQNYNNNANNQEVFILSNLQQAIEQHYKIKHTASDYSNLLNTSNQILAKISKKYFHKTLSNLIADRIVVEAKRELYFSGKSIKEIAFELGYEDQYYFSRFFKKNTKISPQLFRQSMNLIKLD